MSTKDPTPRADALRAQREARYGHLQAKVDEDRAERLAELRRAAEQKMRPYAGKSSKGIVPVDRTGPRAEAQEQKRKVHLAAKKARQRANYKRRTALPKDSNR
jgi:hypothetical protein